jgi:predicted nucleotidyltransferase
MRPTLTIEDIYATPARAKVLRALALTAGPLSVRSTGRAAGISHTAAGVVLEDLESMGLVHRWFVGRAHSYTLMRSSIYVREMVLPAVAAEAAIISELCRDLSGQFEEDSLSLILFGSYAYGEQRESSDIDLFALAEDSRRKQLLQDRALARGVELLDKYGSSLSLMVFTRPEAREYLRDGKSGFRTELASTGIILHGLGVDEWGIDGQDDVDEDRIEG